MFDRSMPGRGKSPALAVLTLALMGSSSRALADTPVDKKPAEAPGDAPTVAPAAAPGSAPSGTPSAVPSAAPSAAPAPAPVEAPAPATAPRAAPAASVGDDEAKAKVSPSDEPTTIDAGLEEDQGSWFARAPLSFSVGHGAHKWTLTAYGFVEVDYIFDSTRSYDDSIGSALVARSDTYAGTVGRSQFSIRNSRLGFVLESPTIAGVKPSAVIEADFFGTSTSPPASSEGTFFDNPGFRLRQAYLKLQNDYVDLVAGQTYDVFGWQNYFFPCTTEFLGLPNQLFSRNAQLRLSHTFGATGPVALDIAAAGVRPAQRDSMVPDANAGLRLSVNHWKGITTPGNVGTVALPLSIGVSGTLRQFKVNAFTPPPTQSSNSAMGWGVSVDALIPVIPATSARDRSNRLTLTGSFVTGSGISDLLNANGGASFPTLPNPAQANPPPLYSPDIDNGLVTFDTQGVLHTIDWQAFRVGLQYYFPPTGRLIFSANYTQANSKNMAKLFPRGGAEIELLGSVANVSQYADVNLFFDVTPAVRIGVSGQYTRVEYLDGDHPHNLRAMGQAVYVF
jgi:hypothetical protein